MLPDALEIHFLDMVKFHKTADRDARGNPLHRWLTYLDPASPGKLVEEIINMDTAIRKAEEKLTLVSSDKEALHAYQMREMALSDWTSGVNFARQEGHKEGKIEGKIETAKNLKAMGIAVEQITHATGLTAGEIGKL
jgi:predicted transposase/invertase (TIGR01784 family)